jgi:hypothetical protein
VTVSDWIDGVELHRMPGVPPAGGRLAAISHFAVSVSSEDLPPAERAVGWWLDPAEEGVVRDQLRAFLCRHARPMGGGVWRAPRLRLTEGDLVWTGERIVAIAASPAEIVPEARWHAELALLEVDGGDRLQVAGPPLAGGR